MLQAPLPLQCTPWLLHADMEEDRRATCCVVVMLTPLNTQFVILQPVILAQASSDTVMPWPLACVTRQLVSSNVLAPPAAAPGHITAAPLPQPTSTSPEHTHTLLPPQTSPCSAL